MERHPGHELHETHTAAIVSLLGGVTECLVLRRAGTTLQQDLVVRAVARVLWNDAVTRRNSVVSDYARD